MIKIGKIHKWKQEELQFLVDNVKGITNKELTEKFNKKFKQNVTEDAVMNQRHKLKIRSGYNSGCFSKGRTPYNKGKSWNEYMSIDGQKQSRKTTFNKGNKPKNSRPIGSERIDKDGYIEIKYQDGHRNKNWITKNRYLYEKYHNCKIQKEDKVIFADGNNRNFAKDNLILVSSTELAIMNKRGLYKRNKALTIAGVSVAKIISKIKEKGARK